LLKTLISVQNMFEKWTGQMIIAYGLHQFNFAVVSSNIIVKCRFYFTRSVIWRHKKSYVSKTHKGLQGGSKSKPQSSIISNSYYKPY